MPVGWQRTESSTAVTMLSWISHGVCECPIRVFRLHHSRLSSPSAARMCGRGDLDAKRLIRGAKHALKSIQLNLEIQVRMCRANPKPPLNLPPRKRRPWRRRGNVQWGPKNALSHHYTRPGFLGMTFLFLASLCATKALFNPSVGALIYPIRAYRHPPAQLALSPAEQYAAQQAEMRARRQRRIEE